MVHEEPERVSVLRTMALRDDHIRILLSRETLVLPHSSHEALRVEVHKVDSMRDVHEALEAIEPPELLRLTATQKAALVQLIERWAIEVDGRGGNGLPSGILELRNALCVDLQDATRR
jgi:hypothetical protein